jgi:hypothetical protein
LAVGSGAIGLTGAYMLRQFLSRLLFGVSTVDPAIYVGFTAALLLAVLAACYGPGARAATIEGSPDNPGSPTKF